MRTIAIVNQKGGCGKTTTAINLSACLAASHKKVLLIDLDPQSHASIGLNIKVEELEKSAYDIFSASRKIRLEEVMVKSDSQFDLVPSQVVLSAVEQELAGRPGRESVLLHSIQKLGTSYDYIIVDCPPNLGMLTFNALRACTEAHIPIEMSDFYKLRGMDLRNLTATLLMCLVNWTCETYKLQEGEMHNDENFSCIFYQQHFIRRLFVCFRLCSYSQSLHKNNFAA